MRAFFLFHRRDRGLVVTRPTTPLDGRSLGNSIKPLQHMRERFHLLSREAANLPLYVDLRLCLDIRDRVFALSCTCQVVSKLPCISSGEADLKDPKDTQRFVLESIDGDLNLRFEKEEYVHGTFSGACLAKYLICPW